MCQVLFSVKPRGCSRRYSKARFDDSEVPGEVVSGRCFGSESSLGHLKQQTAVPSGKVGVIAVARERNTEEVEKLSKVSHSRRRRVKCFSL